MNKLTHQRIVVMTEGLLDPFTAKTAACVIRYRPDDVVAVLDSEAAGENLADRLGYGGDIPIVASIADAARFKPDALLVGIAPIGGQLPDVMRRHTTDAIRAGLDVICGLHLMLRDDEELSTLARKHSVELFDVRDPGPMDRIAFGRPRQFKVRRILTVGADCSVGKMVTTLELARAACAAGRDAAFVPTGQTGIMIEGWGIAVDRVIADFTAGAAEWLVEQVADRELAFVEGQGSITHPGYAGVTLALLHGSCPDAMIMCTRAGHKHHHDRPDCPIPPATEQIALYESLTKYLHPAKVVAVSVNTLGLTEKAAQAEIARTAEETGLPTTDPIRCGCAPLLEAIQ